MVSQATSLHGKFVSITCFLLLLVRWMMMNACLFVPHSWTGWSNAGGEGSSGTSSRWCMHPSRRSILESMPGLNTMKQSWRSAILRVCLYVFVWTFVRLCIRKECDTTKSWRLKPPVPFRRWPAGYEHRPSSAVVTTDCRCRLHQTSSERASRGRTARDKPCLPDTGIFRSRRASWENRSQWGGVRLARGRQRHFFFFLSSPAFGRAEARLSKSSIVLVLEWP